MNPKPISLKIITMIMLLTLALAAVGEIPARAAQTGRESALPEGLSTEDWSQIRSSLTAFIPAQQAYLKASNTNASDSFGITVAVSGDTVAVGAAYEDSNASGVGGDQTNNSATNAGAVYVFTRSGTTWTQQAYLKASNTGAGDYFGASLALSGDTLTVGAPNEDGNATNGEDDNSLTDSGAVYVFTRSSGTWTQQAYLKASNPGQEDYFGGQVDLSGDTLVASAQGEDSNATGVGGDQNDNSLEGAGAAYVFTRSGTTWSQQAYLKASNTEEEDMFGRSVGISGDTVVVGAGGEDSNATGVNGSQTDNSANNSGAAYVFVRSGTNWSQQAYLKASNTGAEDVFSRTLAIDGDTVVVGAMAESSSATGVNGNESDDSASGAGAAYVFVRSGTAWSQQAYLKASNTDANDYFGVSVAISGNQALIGAFFEDSNATGMNGDQGNDSVIDSGAAYLFSRSGTTWSQDAYLKASNTGLNDAFGFSVSLDAETLVIAAYHERSNATGVNGDQADDSAINAGAAYVLVPNSAPTDISLSNSSVAENQPVGTLVGALTTTDPDPWGAHTYSLACATPGADDASFQISGIDLQTSAVFDYETKNSYAICIKTDDGGATFEENFTISVTNVIEIITMTLRSTGTYDGHILESGELTNVGGTLDRTSPTFILGDGALNKQYRAILHFNTGGLPDNAVITKVTLKIRRQGGVGTNPFTLLGGLKVDMRKPFFGTTLGLVISDFQAVAGKNAVAVFGATPVSNWYSANLNATGRAYINKTGTTQFRLRFAVDDNNDNAADYMRFYSGNYATLTLRPTLVIEYYIP